MSPEGILFTFEICEIFSLGRSAADVERTPQFEGFAHHSEDDGAVLRAGLLPRHVSERI